MGKVEIRVLDPQASAEDMEANIVVKLEQQLKTLPEVEGIVSSATAGGANVEITFSDTEISDSLFATLTRCIKEAGPLPEHFNISRLQEG